jgi:formylglycine-generating enzyme required for sulfatase activity
MLHLKIFLSSPGDVAEERALAVQVIERLNYDPLLSGRITLKPIAWDMPGSGAPMLATVTPQQAVNDGMPTPAQCDIVVVIFWTRMGTPLPPEYTKPDGSRYLSGTEWEYLDAVNHAREHGTPDVLVYRRTADVAFSPSNPDFMQKYEQWQHVQRFFEQFTAPDGSLNAGYNPYQQPEDFRERLEHHIRALIKRRLEHGQQPPPQNTTSTTVKWQGSPFPGLRAFTPEDAPIFFGRGRETDALVQRLRSQNIVVVVGASGAGKSSLVMAGLVPRVKLGALGVGRWEVERITPGVDPAGVLTAATGDFDQNDHLLLVVDQFEELFTTTPPDRRADFLHTLTTEHPNRKTVLTLRADFFQRALGEPLLVDVLHNGAFPLAAPGTAALWEMITRPAELAGIPFEEGLVQRILDDVGSESGALALLAYTLDELYHDSHDDGQLTHEDYDALGGVQGAIGQRADAAFSQLGDAARAALPIVFRELVTVDDGGTATRRRCPVADVTPTEDAAQLVEALTAARLLVQSEQDGRPTIEIAHEALLRSWPALHDWLQSTTTDLRIIRRLRNAARQWATQDYSADYLWIGQQLEDARTAVEKLQPVLSDTERDFLIPEQERLLTEAAQPETPHHRRVVIGERLAIIGDSRPGVGLTEDSLPDLIWCDVPGGEVVLSREKTEVSISQRTFKVNPFRITKYPITYGQFNAFVAAEDGYAKDWWEGLGRHRTRAHQARELDNHPAEFISWYEATAFARWLSTRLGRKVRLPLEWEWLLAAQGSSVQAYPWGKHWNHANANTRDSNLLRTTAVGLYPMGESPFGVQDMVGNVWEWCINELENPGKLTLESKSTKRALRGCSCMSRSHKAKLSYRAGNVPNVRNEAHGFRLVWPEDVGD